ncbi:AAA family ATPase [Candidatus Nomurabacteria bacterium]|nr:AAA family ATPase [Candidatus Nomurabacteria bacterium]
MNIFTRPIQLNEALENNKVAVIYGVRQVGKTTLVKKFLSTYKNKNDYFTGDDLEFAEAISMCSLEIFRKMFSDPSLIVIDEALKIENIGRAVKLIGDNMDDIKVILTGSSSFDLANKTGESLTGRKIILTLYPVPQKEILRGTSQFHLEKDLPEYLIYGSYPAVLTAETYTQKGEKLRELVNSYLIKDLLAFNLVKSSKPIRDLLKLLAFQIGGEVSLNELASNLEIDKNTGALLY